MFQPPPPLEEIAPPIPPMQPAIAGLATSAEVITGYFPAPGSLGLSFHDAGSRVTVLNVKPDGAAGQQPALRPGLRLKTVQGQDVSSAAYSQVIDLIKAGGRPLTLKFDLPAAAMAPSAPAPAQALPSAQAPVSPVPAPAMALPPAPALAPGPALQLSPVRQEEDPKDVEHPLAVVATSSESEVDEYFCDGCDPDAEKASLAGIMFSKGDASKDDGTEDLCQACYDRVPQDRQVEYRQVDLASTAVVEEFFCDKCDPDGEKLALTSCMFSKIEGDEEDLCQACFSGLPSEQHAGYERVELPPGSDVGEPVLQLQLSDDESDGPPEFFCDSCDPDAEKASLAGIMFSKGDASKDDGTEDLCQACYDRVPQDRQVEYRQVDLASTAVVEEFFCDKCDPDGEKLALTSCMFSKIEGDEEDLCQACFSGLPSEQHAGYERVELPPGSDDEGGVAAPLVEIDDVPSTVLPPHWATHVDQASGRPYWHNALSGETSWSDPAAALALHVSKTLELSHLEPPAEPAAAPLPVPAWAKHVDQASGRPYWHNALTGETSWGDPDAAQEQGPATPEPAKGAKGTPVESTNVPAVPMPKAKADEEAAAVAAPLATAKEVDEVATAATTAAAEAKEDEEEGVGGKEAALEPVAVAEESEAEAEPEPLPQLQPESPVMKQLPSLKQQQPANTIISRQHSEPAPAPEMHPLPAARLQALPPPPPPPPPQQQQPPPLQQPPPYPLQPLPPPPMVASVEQPAQQPVQALVSALQPATAPEPLVSEPEDPLLALRQQLEGLANKELRARARGSGVGPAELEDAADADDPRATLVSLLVSVEGAALLARLELEKLLSELSNKQLRTRGRVGGLPNAALEEAADADDPRLALLTLLVGYELDGGTGRLGSARGSYAGPQGGDRSTCRRTTGLGKAVAAALAAAAPPPTGDEQPYGTDPSEGPVTPLKLKLVTTQERQQPAPPSPQPGLQPREPEEEAEGAGDRRAPTPVGQAQPLPLRLPRLLERGRAEGSSEDDTFGGPTGWGDIRSGSLLQSLGVHGSRPGRRQPPPTSARKYLTSPAVHAPLVAALQRLQLPQGVGAEAVGQKLRANLAVAATNGEPPEEAGLREESEAADGRVTLGLQLAAVLESRAALCDLMLELHHHRPANMTAFLVELSNQEVV